MFSSFDFCIPSRSTTVPSGPDWLHEVKYDGYRLRAERDGDRVRLITRGGYDWTKRYPWIVEAALKNRVRRFVLDGEAVILGVDGISDFNALHSNRHNDEVQLCAFDVLAIDGDDLRKLPLSMRKADLERLLARRARIAATQPPIMQESEQKVSWDERVKFAVEYATGEVIGWFVVGVIWWLYKLAGSFSTFAGPAAIHAGC